MKLIITRNSFNLLIMTAKYFCSKTKNIYSVLDAVNDTYSIAQKVYVICKSILMDIKA